MSKVAMMRKALSADALEVLGLAGSSTIGHVIQSDRPGVMVEFRKCGVVGRNDGLTIVGSALAGIVQAEVMDALF